MTQRYRDAPVVDVAPLFDGTGAVDAPLIQAIGEGFRRQGAIVAVGAPEVAGLDAWAATMLRFFDLDEAQKLAVATRRNRPESANTYRGYVSTREERRWAYNEMYDIGPERPCSIPPLRGAEIFAEPNLWPADEPAPGWRAAMQAYFRQMERLGLAVLEALTVYLGFPKEAFAARFDEGNTTLRLLNYPPRPEGLELQESIPEILRSGADQPQLVAGRHTDACALSLLWQREPGLQAQSPDGQWQDIPALPNSVSLHLGDVFETMTGGLMRATPHRVIDSGETRCSIGFFVEPNLSASLAPFEGTSEIAERPGGDSYAAHLLRRFSHYNGYESLVQSPD